MKTTVKVCITIAATALISLSVNAQQAEKEKQVKVFIKTTDDGKTDVFESSELTPEVEKKLKEAGVNVSELKNGSKISVHKKIIRKTDGTEKSNHPESKSISIFTSSEKDSSFTELINIDEGKDTEGLGAYSFTTSGDDVKVIVNGEEINVKDDKKFHKQKTIIFISSNLTNSTLEERKKVGITEVKEQLEIKEINCIPNPTNGKFKVSFETENKSAATIEVRDTNGKIVFTEKLIHSGNGFLKELDLGEKNKGVYFVTITQNNKAVTKKLIVQ